MQIHVICQSRQLGQCLKLSRRKWWLQVGGRMFGNNRWAMWPLDLLFKVADYTKFILFGSMERKFFKICMVSDKKCNTARMPEWCKIWPFKLQDTPPPVSARLKFLTDASSYACIGLILYSRSHLLYIY